jgi:hypothetical protein
MPDALIVVLVFVGLVGLAWVFALLMSFVDSCVKELFTRGNDEE